MQFHCPGNADTTSATLTRTVGLLRWLRVPLVKELTEPPPPHTLQGGAAILSGPALKQLTSAVKDEVKYSIVSSCIPIPYVGNSDFLPQIAAAVLFLGPSPISLPLPPSPFPLPPFLGRGPVGPPCPLVMATGWTGL